jgi:hypothetical protein
MATLQIDNTAYIEVARGDGRGLDETRENNLVEVTEDAASLIGSVIGRVVTSLKPDLKAIGGSKATVKVGAKLGIKNGKLTAWVTEVSGEGSVEVAVEFTS